MTIPSFENEWVGKERAKPRIQALEVRDRKRPDDGPIVWLLVERQETYRRDQDGSMYEASICLSYERVMPRYARRDVRGQPRFDGSYSKLQNMVSLTSSSLSRGAVFLDLPGLEGHRIGTYLLNEIVTWVQRWPGATVNSVELRSEQGRGENKERRNRFYEQFGLVFDYTNSSREAGHSRLMPVEDLTQVDTWKKNITEHNALAYLADVLYTKERVSSELQQRTRAIEDLVKERRRAESRPMRWALKTLYYQNAGIVSVGMVLGAIAAALWLRF